MPRACAFRFRSQLVNDMVRFSWCRLVCSTMTMPSFPARRPSAGAGPVRVLRRGWGRTGRFLFALQSVDRGEGLSSLHGALSRLQVSFHGLLDDDRRDVGIESRV